MEKNEIIKIFEEVLEDWFSIELFVEMQCGGESEYLEEKRDFIKTRFMEAINK
ncbi:hypothetical protein OTK50_00630 [Bacillus sp. NEAU-CP5]|uniref:hypothetical protein n=1 Tax=Bacillus TaxID=1386 RepID=UPI001CCCA6D7|nr:MULTISPECIES: hypothetical protein [Bacillus]MCX3303730.1 hypothetical protein [Bacillus velezensis]MCX8438330.1 hypothetical protein [Bacillus sp. NEAU-CP5]ULH18488.1 hypothetical protein MF598_10930 [Bacillus velezensis]WJF83523.1 hypothetical protein QRA13_02995 [Bacillus velezensis]